MKIKGSLLIPIARRFKWWPHLKPLYDRYGISRIIVSTYQAVSGAGSSAIDELLNQSSDVLD